MRECNLSTHTHRGLEMSPYMLGDAAKNVTPDHSATYDLYATVNHYGTVSVGHYMSCVRPPTEEGGAKGEGKRPHIHTKVM